MIRIDRSLTALALQRDAEFGLRELGAREVVTDLDELQGRYDLILESAGGDSLGRLATMVHFPP